MHHSRIRIIFLCTTALIIVGVLSISFSSFIAQANVYHLYASMCLGGWENPHLAAGEPEFTGDGRLLNESNSARLNGDVQAHLYCGGFSGKILENTVPTKILVKLSASAVDLEVAKTQEIVITPEFSEAVELQEALGDESLVEDPASEESTPEEPTTSLLNLFVNVARAQEIETEDMGETGTEPGSDIGTTSESSSTPETMTPAEEIEVEEVVEDEPSSNPEETIIPDGNLQTEVTSYGIAEVLYTLDGVMWKSLGFVNRDEFGNKHFEIPIEEVSAWENIAKIQVGVQSVPVIDGIVPMMYLDSVWLEVSYRDVEEIIIEEEVVPEEELYEEVIEEEEEVIEEVYEINENPVSNELHLKTRTFNDFVIDINAGHYCSSEDFSINLSVDSPIKHTIQIFGAMAGQEIQLIVGSLPMGIDVFFSENRDYAISLPGDRGYVEVELAMQEGAQMGNFTIPIIYNLKKGEEASSVVCQINVVNL